MRSHPMAQARPAAPAPSPAGSAGADGTPRWAAKALEEVLTPAYWFDPGEQGEPYRVTVWFSGRRTGITGKPKPNDTFRQEETYDGIVPGTGPVAVTAEVRGINPGEWMVTARPVARAGSRVARPYVPAGDGTAPGHRRGPSPRRLTIPSGPRARLATVPLPFTKVPGVVRFLWTGLVILGMLAGLGVQAALLAHADLPIGSALLFSVAAVAAGVAAAKIWYIAVHRGRRFDGWCIQGFVAGAGAVAVSAPFLGLGIAAGTYFSAATPGLLIGMAIGRPGCFWAGCCAGRPTASRWGIWSSDRRIGCRRIPAQLLEAVIALFAGLGALTVVLVDGLSRSGPVAVAAVAAYTVGRQFVLGLRAEPPRRTRLIGPATAAVAAAALVTSITVLAWGVA